MMRAQVQVMVVMVVVVANAATPSKATAETGTATEAVTTRATTVSSSANASYKILILHPIYPGSHERVLRDFGEHLAKERGHEVTQLRIRQDGDNPTSESVEILELPLYSHNGTCSEFLTDSGGHFLSPRLSRALWEKGTFVTPELAGYVRCQIHWSRDFLRDRSLFSYLKSRSFDVAIVDLKGNPHGLAMAKALGLPVASFWGFSFQGGETCWVSNYVPPSLYPAHLSGLPQEMSFLQRVQNLMFVWKEKFQELVIAEIFDRIVSCASHHQLPPITELYHDIDLHLVGLNRFTDRPRLAAPNVIHIGGLHLRESNSSLLGKELDTFLDNSEKGVVLFSFGSTFDLGQVPEKTITAIIKGLSKLEQGIVMRLPKNGSLSNDNILAQKWLPQQDILAHPNVLAFVCHGGMFGIQEAIFHRVPVVVIPIWADQIDNAMIVEEKGIGLAIHDKENLDANEIQSKVEEVIKNPRFKAKVNVYAEMWRDSLMSPVEEATYWTEILAKYRNLDHLIINDSHLNTVQYFSIDVIMFLIALVVLAASLIFKGLNRLISLGSAKLKID